MAQSITLEVALSNVERLSNLILADEQPNIEPQPASVVYDVSFDTNFEDRNAFVSGNAKFMEEATAHCGLSKVLKKGDEYASMLYTWRSCSRAVPAVKSNEQENRLEIYKAIIEVLQPEVDKLKAFFRFQSEAIGIFCGEVKKLAHENRRKDFISETYLMRLAQFIDMFSVLDALKNMKASLNNDLAAFKRAEGFVKQQQGGGDQSSIMELQTLSMFLATNNKLTMNLKEALDEIPSYEDILIEVVSLCCNLYETKRYIVPSAKHTILKVIGFSVVLIDGKTSIYKLASKGRINLQRIDKIFKQTPVVPLFGDMQIALVSYIKQTPNFNASHWTCLTEHAEEKAAFVSYNILAKIDTIRAEHLKYISGLTRTINNIGTADKWTDRQVRELTDLALLGLKHIGSWTTHIIELNAWKLLHPVDKGTNDCPETAEEYERATRYNYSSEEKFALIEVIAMIKGLTMLLTRHQVIFIDAINRYVHKTFQTFILHSMRDPIRFATKKKKHHVKMMLIALREMCADWPSGVENDQDPCLRGEKDPKGGFQIELSRRSVAPSSTQLYMCRTFAEHLLSDKGGKKSLRAELDGHGIGDLEEFLKVSFFFPHLINFSHVLQEASDLSQLWYREFFLELTMGKRVQFPIEMSLPWILTDHILETKDASMMEYLLYPLDLYSDAGSYALHDFKQQYLYNEVEAEVNLVFDQLIYKLSEQIFIYYKSLACSILLDKKYRAELGSSIPYPPAAHYETIMLQRHVQILGRSIDINRLIQQRLHEHLLKANQLAIARFESTDLTGIVELEMLIETNRLTHDMLQEFFVLDSFEAIYREANECVNLPHGRAALHCFWEINTDFMPSYCYNSTTNRFVRTKGDNEAGVDRAAAPKAAGYYFYGTKALTTAYNAIQRLYIGFVGQEHFAAMIRLLGYQGIAMVMNELLKQIEIIVKSKVVPYVKAMSEGLPKNCRRPLASYGVGGVLQFYAAKLEPLLQYPLLRTDVAQAFAEIGNALLFCLMMEHSLSLEEALDLIEAAPFQGVPLPLTTQEEQHPLAEFFKEQAKLLHMLPLIQLQGTKQQAQTATDCDLLTRERLCRSLSMFEVVLEKVRAILTVPQLDPIFHGTAPGNGVMHVEDCVEFYRIWSVIQFSVSLPLTGNELSPEDTFGDGLHWGGLTFVYLLGQLHRFEALDFTYHLLSCYTGKTDAKNAPTVSGINIDLFAERIKAVAKLNTNIISVLDTYIKPEARIKRVPEYYAPPSFESAEGVGSEPTFVMTTKPVA
ncbi:cytoplasmic FMR1-interacting protein 2-like [Sycon ciliatum]|uniref:cytoplasmic FMR1-interacting protein 2-like n=1 Tax=Sycon ciliatum TaxID=27933 RepID=UPI0020AD0DA3|eukprot:scpid44441/ scgid4677/ Cytoplasmic FMR1-interacting protein 2